MSDFELYYWPVPFRGQFIRAILAYAGRSWTEHDSAEIGALMQAGPDDAPVGFMGPPVLVDNRSGFTLSQMPAIALYLGDRFALLPDGAEGRAMSVKIVNDANDVIDELTLDGGREMWTGDKWAAFLPRLARWMRIWAAAGERHGLGETEGFLLGTQAAGVADIVTGTLWTTMGDRFPGIAALLDETAPRIAALSRRMRAVPALARLRDEAFALYGEAYCGGEIEKSLRSVAGRATI